jgi:glyoxylate reductase
MLDCDWSSDVCSSDLAIALRAAPFGLTVQYHNRHRLPESVEKATHATWVETVDELLSTSDFVSINCPATDETRGMIDARRIALLKPDAYLINTSRAEVYDEEALIDALQNERIGGAGLDVFAHEPAVDERLLNMSNVVLKPHMGSATFEGREATGDKVIANIRTWVDGHRPRDQVLEGLI